MKHGTTNYYGGLLDDLGTATNARRRDDRHDRSTSTIYGMASPARCGKNVQAHTGLIYSSHWSHRWRSHPRSHNDQTGTRWHTMTHDFNDYQLIHYSSDPHVDAHRSDWLMVLLIQIDYWARSCWPHLNLIRSARNGTNTDQTRWWAPMTILLIDPHWSHPFRAHPDDSSISSGSHIDYSCGHSRYRTWVDDDDYWLIQIIDWSIMTITSLFISLPSSPSSG